MRAGRRRRHMVNQGGCFVKIADQILSELERLDAYYSYRSRDGFVVFENPSKGTVIYQEGVEVVVSDAVIELLKSLPDRAGAPAVYDALDLFNEEGEE